MNWPFSGKHSRPAPSAHTDLEQQLCQKVVELDARMAGLEQAIIDLCQGLKMQLDRIDHNTVMLDKNMHNLAAMTLRPPKNLLEGGQEPN
jgi:hypothetical protein